MPLFVCEKCNTIDNTACGGNYWYHPDEQIKCCECHTGQWHNRFPKNTATKEKIDEIGRSNFLFTNGL